MASLSAQNAGKPKSKGKKNKNDKVQAPLTFKSDMLPGRPLTAGANKPSYCFKTLTRQHVNKVKTPVSCTIPVGHYRPNHDVIQPHVPTFHTNVGDKNIDPFRYVSKNSLNSLYTKKGETDTDICSRVFRAYDKKKIAQTKLSNYVPTLKKG
jgi:hypothetical protein